MSILQTGIAKSGAADAYEIDNSCRFNGTGDGAAGDYLTRTTTSAGSGSWTLSTWIKISNLSDGTWSSGIFGAAQGGAATQIYIESNDKIRWYEGGGDINPTARVFRDPSAWYHLVFQKDADTSMKIYVNGELTDTNTSSVPATSPATNSGATVYIGQSPGLDGTRFASFCGYQAEVYFVDGSVLEPSDFGETSSTTNEWIPLDSDDVKDAITFGTNGFYQKYGSTEDADDFEDAAKYTATSFTTVESTTWTVPAGVTSVEYLVVGGGGGGAGFGGGGGAGAFRTGTLSVTPAASLTVTVGAGGTQGIFNEGTPQGVGTAGGDSVFSSITSAGGGQGGAPGNRTGYAGGSGGGGNDGYAGGAGGSYGNNGGAAGFNTGGGGGGATGVGGTAPANTYGGTGGAGTASSITGASVTYAGGGGGGTSAATSGWGGAGGAGGGGAGNPTQFGDAFDGTANTGGGGGGGGYSDGGNGGSGIVVLRYVDESGSIPGHTITASGDVTNQRPQPHTVTANGHAHLIGPKQGTSIITFDGTGDYLTAPDSADWDFGGDAWTTEFWLNPNTLPAWTIPLAHSNESNGHGWYIAWDADSIQFFTDSNTSQFDVSHGFVIGTWSHVALSSNGTTLKAFIDGAEVASVSAATIQADSNTLRIGGIVAGYALNGYMDSVRISDSARYTAAFDPPTSAFTNDSDTKLLIQSGTDGSQTFTDSSSGSHSITANGDVRWFAPKVGAGAMAFDGTGDYFSIASGTGLAFGTGDFTIEAWVKFSTVQNQGIMLLTDAATNYAPYFQYYGGELQFGINGIASVNTYSWTPTAHTWYHVAAARSGSTCKLFIDGSEVDSDSNSTDFICDGVLIGAWASRDWDGYMDMIRISKVARYTGTYSVPTTAFTDDINTALLLNADINQGTWNPDSSTGLAISEDSRIEFEGTSGVSGGLLTIPASSDFTFGTDDVCIEMWMKTTQTASSRAIARGSSPDEWFIRSDSTASEFVKTRIGGSTVSLNTSSTEYVSDGAWHHIALQRTSTALRLYIDGIQRASNTSISGSWDVTSASEDLGIGVGIDGGPDEYFDGYLDEIRISVGVDRYPDGTTFTPQTRGNPFTPDSYTKLLIHSDYTGGLGADSSGNFNAFTPTNLVATDQMIDTPTNNFATLNPLYKNDAGGGLTEGNLSIEPSSSSHFAGLSTISVSSGKWYWEMLAGGSEDYIGIVADTLVSNTSNIQTVSGTFIYRFDGYKRIDGTATTYGATYTTGDIMGAALDLDSSPQTITFYKNNATQGSLDLSGAVSTAASVIPVDMMATNDNFVNFGQDSSFAGNETAQGNQDDNDKGDFYYEPPSGFLALCTANLSAPEIALPGENFNTVLYTGNATARSITDVGFQPDFIWFKNRGQTDGHLLYDAVRGFDSGWGEALTTNVPDAQVDYSEGLSSFDSDGFSIGTYTGLNSNTYGIASWNWLGANSTATNTDGTDIDSTVSANPTAGFSIVKWTGTGATDDSVGHGLSQAPELIIIKNMLDGGNDWATWHDSFPVESVIYLNDAGAAYIGGETGRFNTLPTPTVFTPGDAANVNADTKSYIAYCFHSVDGYSKVGSYVGNSNTDGPFIYTGFKPAFIMVKLKTAADGQWAMFDNKRDPYNPTGRVFYANLNAISTDVSSYTPYDILSNGFKSRIPGGNGNEANYNSTGQTYIYLAFAESPFKYSNAR